MAADKCADSRGHKRRKPVRFGERTCLFSKVLGHWRPQKSIDFIAVKPSCAAFQAAVDSTRTDYHLPHRHCIARADHFAIPFFPRAEREVAGGNLIPDEVREERSGADVAVPRCANFRRLLNKLVRIAWTVVLHAVPDHRTSAFGRL
ncbi:hypothetical protein H7F36_00175 [Variovorax sp. PAMC28562]|uniref:hypothetical protein n=1 Tax=Variovorax sp. PAMC28562 TaxID=2762323 RepID=UPI00164DF64C|nr:hypothetical protein [Variovorax sp. PAMC28562]QNK73738.1 hypothetical protein H7F36_00175 [Variovorax sp. PAMC28562]